MGQHLQYLSQLKQAMAQMSQKGGQMTLQFGQSQLPSMAMFAPKPFSKPYSPVGYTDNSITDEMVTQIYLDFCTRARNDESWTYQTTIFGKCIHYPKSPERNKLMCLMLSHRCLHELQPHV